MIKCVACFALNLLYLRQKDGKATFQNEFRNWTKSWFYYKVILELRTPPLLWCHDM